MRTASLGPDPIALYFEDSIRRRAGVGVMMTTHVLRKKCNAVPLRVLDSTRRPSMILSVQCQQS